MGHKHTINDTLRDALYGTRAGAEAGGVNQVDGLVFVVFAGLGVLAGFALLVWFTFGG